MKTYLPSLREGDDQVDMTTFGSQPKTIVLAAKWWMRPICWLTGKPTTRTIWR